MVHKILFWGGFGLAVRLWSLGMQMRPVFQRDMKFLMAYPIYAAIGGGFGYWLEGVEARQSTFIEETKQRLLEKRRRVAEREAAAAAEASS